MKKRIPLQIREGRIVLTAVIKSKSLRIHNQIADFVVDTGSPNSYLSNKEVIKLQIPFKGQASEGEIDFGGSRFRKVSLPKVKMYLLGEDKQKNNYVTLNVSLSALKTTKSSERKIQTAQMLPSILGLDFLREQKLSLHVILTEEMAFLECEG